MRIETNEKLYKRNTRLALVGNLLGLFLLAGSVFVLFSSEAQFGQYLLFLLGGILFTQIGGFFGRWNKRPDIALNHALKSLDHSYTIYHYRSPVAHLLLGPSGIWILMPRFTKGTVTYDASRRKYRVKSKLLSRFTQEGIGRPVQDASLEAEFLDNFLQKNWVGSPLHVQAGLVFVDPQTEVQAGDAPVPTVSIEKVKQLVTRGDGKGHLSREQISKLNELFQSKYS